MKKIPGISDSEWVIMKILWESHPQTANSIIDKIPRTTGWNPKTVKTLINRLVKKNAVKFEKAGKEYLYSPSVKKEECIRVEKKSLLEKLYDGERKSMLKSFIEEEDLTENEINELMELLKRKADKHGKND